MEACTEVPLDHYHLTLGPHTRAQRVADSVQLAFRYSTGGFEQTKVSVEQRQSLNAFSQPGSILIGWGVFYL